MVESVRSTMSDDRRIVESPACGLQPMPDKEGPMEDSELKKQLIQKIIFYISGMTEKKLQIVNGFVRGVHKS